MVQSKLTVKLDCETSEFVRFVEELSSLARSHTAHETSLPTNLVDVTLRSEGSRLVAVIAPSKELRDFADRLKQQRLVDITQVDSQ